MKTNFTKDIIFFQRLLASSGFYKGKIDGVRGAKTDLAIKAFDKASRAAADKYGEFDPRSEANIATLQPKAQVLARRVLKIIRDRGINARIIAGTRTYAEQNSLFAKGRYGNTSPVVTKARGGQSNHNFGIAWDIGIFDEEGKYLADSPKYGAAGETVIKARITGVEWGGNWKTFKDVPHYQCKTGKTLAEVRRMFEAGRSIV